MKIELRNIIHIYLAKRWALLLTVVILATARAEAQTDSTAYKTDPLEKIAELPLLVNDTVLKTKKPKRDWSTWSPDPQRALWLALVIPGGGQIYNRKYWKLPLVYGGFMGCLYAMSWNNMMYKDYSQAYLDIMDSDPTTQSYNRFLHFGMTIDSSNEERYKKIFKSRKDKYRRWRDMSFFCLIGVYALSVIDAYVDAELSQFDISDDLSLKVEPTLMNNGNSGNILEGSSIGVNVGLRF
ncbi:MAG: DUF5683 domain-containing protein [Prevotella sp.]|nr:DUF5683 domain-containing protein [Prevotella sp.]MDD5894878.1 DUF5683 domain-containing protein [Prevotellaceae bacterium]